MGKPPDTNLAIDLWLPFLRTSLMPWNMTPLITQVAITHAHLEEGSISTARPILTTWDGILCINASHFYQWAEGLGGRACTIFFWLQKWQMFRCWSFSFPRSVRSQGVSLEAFWSNSSGIPCDLSRCCVQFVTCLF